jgi:RHS repeat-associated protein
MDDLPIANVDTTGGTSTIAYVTADQLGTPRAIATSSGTTEWQNPYHGNPWNEVAPTSNGYVYNLGFPGQYFDAETGEFYNGPRYYDPGRGGYDQPDPIGQAGGIGIYIYGLNNPLSNIDPLGLCPADQETGRYAACNASQDSDSSWLTNKAKMWACKKSVDYACKNSANAGASTCCGADYASCAGQPLGMPPQTPQEAQKMGQCMTKYATCMGNGGNSN